MAMTDDDLFPRRPAPTPRVYAYADSHPQYAGLLKVGYTAGAAADRVAQQYPVKRPGPPPYTILVDEPAVRADGTTFTDRDVHRRLRAAGHANPDGEWFRCGKQDVQAAVVAVRRRQNFETARDLDFEMRPEQAAAVEKAAAYFERAKIDRPDKTPHFLWNCKMRFGKTFAAYQLALRMGWTKVLVLTFKPAVEDAWEADLARHVDFAGWQFASRETMKADAKNGGTGEPDLSKPTVCFGSFQDYLGRNRSTGGIKTKNEWVHATNWDVVILDEYHFGAWRENAKELFEAEGRAEAKFLEGEGLADFDEETMPITTHAYLYLSGTPFRALAEGEFIEEQIYNWTYADEQRAKTAWPEHRPGEPNPYAALPRMVLMTYRLPEEIRQVAAGGEFDAFDLNTFFTAEGEGADARFKFRDEVQKWLDLLRGQLRDAAADDLKRGRQKPKLPFSDARLLGALTHTLWFLPTVAACRAMANLLAERQNQFYHEYETVVAAGPAAGVGAKALPPVLEAMGDPLRSKTITLTCGKLTTGVTVRPWGGIFMLRNASTPETYFQAAFRVQSPWTVANPTGDDPHAETVVKPVCYVLDFAPNRALRQIADYGCRLAVDESNPEKKVGEFIGFLPVLAYDGHTMKRLDAAAILDVAASGTSATQLARQWESALLVNVENATLRRLMNSEAAMAALSHIEGFRTLNQDLEVIINKSEAVKAARRESNDGELPKAEKKRLSDEEKEFKGKRKEIQEKLQKFAARVPVFMYLTDYRERTLTDVVTKLEPGLFRAVTGLTTADFELLVGLGVFDAGRMNGAVWNFKRYEDASLCYLGVTRHPDAEVGLYNTTLTAGEYRGAPAAGA